MTDTITLAHISDVHLAPITGFHPRYWNLKRALGFLNWQLKRRHVHVRSVADMIAADVLAQRPDHIAVTGDLANIGLPGEYAAALGWLEALGPPDRVSVIPGNHDIYTRRLHGASCLDDWRAYMTSDAWGDAIIGAERRSGVPSDSFPYVRRVGPAALIGLNSAIPTPPFVAAGRLGAAQRDALGRVLDRIAEAGLVRVVMIHHPPLPGQAPQRRALEDAEELEQVLARHGAELVLHGHNHRDMLAWREASHGRFPIIGIASGSAGKAHKNEPLGRYNLLRLRRDKDCLVIACTTRGLDADGGEIVEIGHRRIEETEDDQKPAIVS